MIALPHLRGVLAGFSPLSLAPALWLDAADASTLYDATTGGSLVASGGTVARWEDKSGNARHATQANPDFRPTRVVAAKNGRDALTFDGSNDFLSTVAFAGSETFARFVVFVSLASQYKVIIAQASAYNNPNPGADNLATNTERLECAQNGGPALLNITSKLASSNNTPTGSYVLASQSCDGTNAGHVLRINGATFAASNPYTGNPGTFSKAATAYGIGAYNGGSSPANCRIAEVLHFARALTDAERQQIDRYLAAKWAITL